MMKRVSSRQRLVSWDASLFDGANVDEEDSWEYDHHESTSSSSSPCKPSVIRTTTTEASVLTAATAVTPERMMTLKTVSSMSSMDSYASSCLKRKRGAPVRISALPWELEEEELSAPPAAQEDWSSLPQEVQLSILSFLTPFDLVQNVMPTCTALRQLLAVNNDAEWLWKHQCQTTWPSCVAETAQYTVSIPYFEGPKYHELVPLSLEHYPTAIDETLLAPCRWSRSLHRYRSRGPTELLAVVHTASGKPAIQFTGLVGSGDRCIRSNEPWLPPVALAAPSVVSHQHLRFPSSCSPLSRLFHPAAAAAAAARGDRPTHHSSRSRSLVMMRNNNNNRASFLDRLRLQKNSNGVEHEHERPLIWKPFVVPFVQQVKQDGTKVYNITPRLVQYFEVTILPKPLTGDHDSTTATATFRPNHADPEIRFRHARGTPECVAVGISAQEFSLHTRMPGWDHCSYGYHGDDGGVFFGTGHMLRDYGPTFGAGDVVGCGIDYHAGTIFYTLNGTYLGPAWHDLNPEFYEQEWYPTVGIDTTCLVHCNFGIDHAFQFDLGNYIQKHHETPMLERQEQYCRSSISSSSSSS